MIDVEQHERQVRLTAAWAWRSCGLPRHMLEDLRQEARLQLWRQGPLSVRRLRDHLLDVANHWTHGIGRSAFTARRRPLPIHMSYMDTIDRHMAFPGPDELYEATLLVRSRLQAVQRAEPHEMQCHDCPAPAQPGRRRCTRHLEQDAAKRRVHR